MKYAYSYVTGKEEVEISKEWAAIMEEMDRAEAANDKKETRRHLSLEHAEEDGCSLTDDCTAETALIAKEDRVEINAFLTGLTDTQRRRLLLLLEGRSTYAIAARENVNQSKIMKTVNQIRKKYEKYYE